MTEFVNLSRGWDHLGNIERTLGDLQGVRTAIHELIQNADDAPGATRMRFRVEADRFEVWNDGVFDRCPDVSAPECGWLHARGHRCDFHSFRKMASGDKRNRPGTTGAFGVGFTAVYQFTDRPELLSNGEHWFVDEMAPEQARIKQAVTPTACEGTTFILPWATESSPFRKAVRQEPVSRQVIASFMDELIAAIPLALPFLRKVRTIELQDSSRSRRFDRTSADGRVAVTGDNGERFEWVLLECDFEQEATALKAAHAGVIEEARSAAVSVAVPLVTSHPPGLLYATLPTEEPSHLPLLINADFVPASDRKRIRFDDSPVSDWNRLAVRAAADLVANNLERLAEAMGDKAFVALVVAARDLSRRTNERIEPAFAEFWASIADSIVTASVVLSERGYRGRPDVVHLWADDEAELAAAGLLQELGVYIVDHSVRADWYGLRGWVAGLRNLTLGDVTEALRGKGLVKRWTASDASGMLADEQGLHQLWALVEFLLSVNDRWNQESRQALLNCAVAPGWDGAIWPFSAVFRADQVTQGLFADLNVDAVFLDDRRLEGVGTRLAEIVADATPDLALGWVEQVLLPHNEKVIEGDRRRLLSWFYEARKSMDENGLRRLARLPIFPTAAGSKSLVGLALPGDFTDELGLAQLVDVDAIPDMASFLTKLGARTLDFPRYCTDFLPEAIAQGDLTEEKRSRLLGLLARKFSEVQDKIQVRDALRPLSLVPCTDRQWRKGAEVYLEPSVRAIVGDDIVLAAISSVNPSAQRGLFRWLGAAIEPRPHDIEARCQQLRTGQRDHRAIAEAIMTYVGDRYALDPAQTLVDFGRLREIPWLPAEGDAALRGHLPSSLYGTFRKPLFASQARFIEVPPKAQRDADFLEKWLRMPVEPTARQVVDHLLWSAEHGQAVGEGTWIYLNQRADDLALDALLHRQCLLIADTSTYVKPEEVYWGEHPFGRFRHQLGPRFGDYRALLERLQVRQHPHSLDAIDVLLDVAAHHGGERAPLLAEDAMVVNACWRLLSSGIESGAIEPSRLEELGFAEAVLDGRGWLRKPTDVFFRDAKTLADRFDAEVHDQLIDRPEGLWRALAAAGVRDLSDAVETRILEEEAAGIGGVVVDRLKTRRRLILRVLAADDGEAPQKLSAFEERVRLVRLNQLLIDQAVDLGSVVHRTPPFERGALYHSEAETLLFVEAEQPPSWVELARELTRALKVDGFRAPDVAAALRGVIAAETDDEARRDLDELGFRALDEANAAEAEPTIASALGGTPSFEEEESSLENNQPANAEAANAAAGSRETQELSRGSDSGTGGTGPDVGERSLSAGSTTGPSVAAGSDDGAGASTAPTSSSTATAQTQSRLRSYVVPKGLSGQGHHDGSDDDGQVERAGVAAVLKYERDHGRVPEEMPPLNPGFDLRSVDAEEQVRFIEVKSTADVWGARGVAMSSTQFTTAQQRREDFWLYVVESARTSPKVHPINDPASKVDQFFFDDGWRVVVEIEQVDRQPYEPIDLLPTSISATNAVPFFDVTNRSPGVPDQADGWLVWNGHKHTADAFAVRIAGYGLGLAFYGGVALVEPIERAPDDGELVCVQLHNQVDPDSRSERSLRRWTPERDLKGGQLALRLTTDGSVEPLTVTSPDAVAVLGIVRVTARPADLRTSARHAVG